MPPQLHTAERRKGPDSSYLPAVTRCPSSRRTGVRKVYEDDIPPVVPRIVVARYLGGK